MKIIETGIKDLVVIESTVFGDERGYFCETYNKNSWEEALEKSPTFVQDNESMSHAGVLRGLHFQKPPHAQGKLVRVVRGSVLDVAVDLRKGSETYGKHYKIKLSGENKKQMYVPEGFAHGFLTLEDHTIFNYKCTNLYNKEAEGGLLWNDANLGIDWGIEEPKISEKDEFYKSFITFDSPF